MTALLPPALDGEILGPEDTVTVAAMLRPFDPTSRRIITAPAGLSVAELLNLVTDGERRSGLSRGLFVDIGGAEIPPEHWPRVRAKAGTTVTVHALPLGGAGGLRSILGLALAVLVSVAVPFLAPVLGTFAASLVGVGLGIAGSLLVNALFPVNAKPNSRKDQVYSISAGQNEDPKYQPVPRLLGKMRVYPKYGASPYTETRGSDQWLYVLYLLGEGSYSVSDMRIGLTSLSRYDDVDVSVHSGFSAGGQLDFFPSDVVQQDLSVELKNSLDYQVRTTSDGITALEIDLVAPSGIYGIHPKSGKRYAYHIQINIKIAPAGTNSYTDIAEVVFENNSQKPVRRTIRHTVTLGQYDIKMRKVSPDYDDDGTVAEEMQWTALRSYKPGPVINYPKTLTLIELRIRATDQLSGVISDFNCLCTHGGKHWTGSSWVDGTGLESPADLAILVLQGASNPKPVADSGIDWPAFQSWADFCTAQGFRYGKWHDTAQSVLQTLQDLAAAGRAIIPPPVNGKWTVIWDDPSAPVVQHFTPRNSWNYSFTRTYPKLPHALRVKFQNENYDYKEDERLVYADGYSASNATLFEQIEFPGITNADLAWRHGRYHYAQIQLRPEIHRLTVDAEHLVCTRGSRVRIATDVPMLGLTQGRVKSISGNTVVLDERVLVDASQEYVIRFRTSDGTSALWQINEVTGETDTLLLVGTATSSNPLPAAGDLFMFGYAAAGSPETVVMRVKSITAGQDLSAELELVDDAPGIALADQGTIPAHQSNISLAIDSQTLAPHHLSLVESLGDASVGYAPVATLLWQSANISQAATFEVQDQAAGEDRYTTLQTVQARQAVMLGLAPGSHSFRVRGLYGDPVRTTAWSDPLAINVAGTDLTPPDVSDFRLNPLSDLALFQWDQPASPIPYIDLRFTSDTTATQWQQASPIGSRSAASAGSTQAPFRSGVYMAKFVTANGVYSANPALITVINAGLVGLNVVDARTYAAPWTGTKTSVEQVGTGLQLAFLQDFFAETDVFGYQDWFLTDQGVADEGTYLVDTFDLGQVFTSRVVTDMRVAGVNLASDFFAVADVFSAADWFNVAPSEWDTQIQVRTTLDDPAGTPAWTTWRTFVVGDYQARGFQFRVVLDSLAYGITPVLSSLAITIDMPDRVIAGADINTSAAGTITVPFSPPFRGFSGLAVVIQGEQSGDNTTITNKGVGGFDVIVRNAAGTAVVRKIDFIAKGYGTRTS